LAGVEGCVGAQVAGEAVWTEASEAVGGVDAWRAVLAGVGGTLVDVYLALFAREAALAHAFEAALVVDAAVELGEFFKCE